MVCRRIFPTGFLQRIDDVHLPTCGNRDFLID